MTASGAAPVVGVRMKLATGIAETAGSHRHQLGDCRCGADGVVHCLRLTVKVPGVV